MLKLAELTFQTKVNLVWDFSKDKVWVRIIRQSDGYNLITCTATHAWEAVANLVDELVTRLESMGRIH